MKLGRNPRTFDPRIPHMSSLIALKSAQLPAPPIAVDNAAHLPPQLGMMLNDELGDCTCAAYYHARQIWSQVAHGTEITEPDALVQQLYREACGYSPSDPTTDQGGIEQDVLSYLLKTGAPVGMGGRNKILAFLEVDFRNLDDLKRTIYDCGVAYIGVTLPQSVLDNAGDPSIPWGVLGDHTIAGGHAIILHGYDLSNFYGISWGQRYRLTIGFMGQYLEEAYALADQEWFSATGRTPLGMTTEDLEAQMKALKG